MKTFLETHYFKIQWWLLVLMIYALPVLRGISNAFWGAMAAMWIVRRFFFNPKSRFQEGSSFLPISTLIWLGTGLASCFFAIEADDAWKGFGDMLHAAIMFWIVRDLDWDPPRRISLFRHIAFSTTVGCFFAWPPYLIGQMKTHGDYLALKHLQLRSVGHFNQTALYLSIGWFVLLALALEDPLFDLKRNGLPRWILAFIGLSFLATTGRFTIFIAGIFTFLLLRKTRPVPWLTRILLGICSLTLLLAGVSRSLRTRLFFHGSMANRLLDWDSAWGAALRRPWTGVGLNNFKNINLQSLEAFSMGTIDHAHSVYFNALAQTGFPGLFAVFLLMLATGKAIWSLRGKREHLLFYGAGGGWVTIFISGLANTPLHHETALLFFILVGLVDGV